MDASLRQRLISAALCLPVVLALILAGAISLEILLGLITLLAGWELSAILTRLGWPLVRPVLPFLSLALFSLSVLGYLGRAQLPLAAIGWGVPLVWLFLPKTPRVPARGISAWLVHGVGALYLGLLLAYLGRLHEVPGGLKGASGHPAARVFYMLLVTWACDTGAYAFGRLYGRHRLWPEVSPKKTWEGATGGFVLTVLAATVLARSMAGISPEHGALVGATVGIAAQLGDLIESRMKRKAGMKDSGNVIPGHGGLLDRLDSLLMVAPLFYYGLGGWTP